nr:orf279 [Zancudomyces culisetae]AAW49505.1 orf279 [Zancudomyces culisetae]
KKIINKKYYNKKNLSTISDHVPIHKKPLNDNDFGYYLAGLIEGDGSINKINPYISICFYELDTPLAYYIKKKIGYGTILKIKNKRAINYHLRHKDGIIRLIDLINGKLRTNKIIDWNTYIIHKINEKYDKTYFKYNIDNSNLKNNYWLAGFTDSDGSFQIKTIKRNNKKNNYEIRLSYQIDQKTDHILNQIKELFSGYLGFRSKLNTYYFQTVSFSSAYKVIKYLDNYHLLSSKYLNYLKWRKTYLYIQKREHLTLKGIKKIIKIKKTMNSYSNDKFEL